MTVASAAVRFRSLPPERPHSELEQELLATWTAENLFGRSLRARASAPLFVFFEGPPTANGKPGIHHVFARTIKDLFCRHRAMQGYLVPRKAGWDTHGLPVEIEVEKQLGISGKQQIEEIGIAEFNRLCRESVWRYREDWQRLSERIAFWLDYENAYITYTNDYVESVWWALKTLYDNDLLFRGHKILPYCPRCGTPLSSHEVSQGQKDAEDPSVFVALDLTEIGGGPVARVAAGSDGSAAGASSSPALAGERASRRILVWTTTPWTLVSNVALAVHPDLEYVELRRRKSRDTRTVIIAATRAGAVLGDDYETRWEEVQRFPGRDLAGARYARPFEWVALPPQGEQEIVVAETFVSESDGTGVVHMAPAFGADDYAAAQRHALAFVQPVDASGRFPAGMPVVGGKFVKDADPELVQDLTRRGVLWKAGTVVHSYPHCWRCETPLLYYARTSWFVRTTAFKDRMLARNNSVAWHPREVGEGRFGEWLENNIDWAISRERYWGTPLPLWVCDRNADHVEAVGSYEQLSNRLGRKLPADFDPHRPFVDEHAWLCASCAGTMRRTPEVIDTWFDSGSMPFAQWHYPFENRDLVERQYPADFIAEGVDQTRGWFYSLLAIATGLGPALPRNADPAPQGKTAPYGSVVVNDLVLDANGVKMSKSRGNVVDPWEVIDRHGADAVRLFLIASSQVWVPRRFDEQAIRETAGRFLLTLKNVYSGIFALYANFGWEPSPADPPADQRPAIDRWILARLTALEERVDAQLNQYEATAAARAVMEFVVDDLSNWYVRLNRHRFYDVDSADNRAAFATLYEVLLVTTRLLAPFAPFVSDWIHRELTGESVHLAPFTRQREQTAVEQKHYVLDAEPGHYQIRGADAALLKGMEAIRTLATLGRAAREKAGVRVRQPLSRMVCVVPDMPDREESLAPLVQLLSSELNVKQVEFATSADALVTLEARPNFRALGRKFGKLTQQAARVVEALPADALRRLERGEEVSITVEGERRALDHDDVMIVRRATGDLVVEEHGGGAYFAAIDPEVTPELRREGLVRELISRVQRLRREAGYAVSDRITLEVAGNNEVADAVKAFRDHITSEVLAVELFEGESRNRKHDVARTIDIDGLQVRVAITRVG